MNPSAPFILRPVMTTLLMITIIVLGFAAYKNLAVSDLPDVNYPTITVTVPFPGTNPTTMANTVATPLEKQFMAIPGIKYVTSTNQMGITTIVLQFEINKNIDLAAVDVNTAIVLARPQLPPNLPQEPAYKKVNPSAAPIMYITVTSPTLTQGELYDYANTFIGQRISIIEGVSDVNIYGSPTAVRIQIEPGIIASMGITAQDIADAIARENQYLPLGQFDGTYTSSPLSDNGGLLKAKQYDSIIVAYRNGSPVRIKDLGISVDSLKNDRSQKRFIERQIDQPNVTLAILRQPGANAVQVANDIKKLLPSLTKQLPGSLDLITLFDRSESISASIKDVQLTLIVAFILVVLVIFLYLGKLRDTIIPSIVMPMSIIGTFGAMYLLGYTIDNLSLLALILAIGFIVDDAIVVLENIVRRIEGGETPMEAAVNGSKQISFTIISMTLSLIAVFIPLIFMAGIIGKLFQEFSITLTIVTLISGILSLTLTPMLCSRFLPPRNALHSGSFAAHSSQFNDWMLGHYKNGLKIVLEHRFATLMVGLASVLFSIFFFLILPKDFIPDEDIGFIIAYTEAEQGTSSEQMIQYQDEIIKVLKQEPSIASLTSIAATPEYRQGLVFIKMIPRNKRKAIKILIQEFNKKLKDIPGVNVYIKNLPLIDLNIGVQVRGAYQYLMQSLDSEELYKAANTLFEKMKNDPTFQGISTDLEIKTPQYDLHIDRNLASTLGVDALDFETPLYLGYTGNRVSRIQTPIDQYDVILELNRNLQKSATSLDYIYVRSKTTNKLIPINAVATWKEGVGAASINHFAQFPAVTITFNLAPGVALSDALTKLREHATTSSTAQVSGDVKGAAKTFEEAINSFSWLIIVTIFAIYIVLGILYESYIHPLTIISTLPPAILGGLLTLYIAGKPLSLYAFLGIILLIGIVKKNGIMIVDFALNNIRLKGESAEQSIIEACLVRFRPIMMTTVAAIMGALPIALGIGAGAESRQPLGYVIIGGMLVSQMITLFLTPVIYLYLENLRERFIKKEN
ncbi:MAG: efflux RND transporter permease subunit [Parachlamydiaceae bacterium]|nr:efflux RND transporter permease subunit [Parachlamydiaceae bacterium]